MMARYGCRQLLRLQRRRLGGDACMECARMHASTCTRHVTASTNLPFVAFFAPALHGAETRRASFHSTS